MEIERKFLVATNAWLKRATGHVMICDGIVAQTDGRKVRVRTYDQRATLTVKGLRSGPAREEFEYEIPYGDALQMLGNHCGTSLVRKARYLVPEGDLRWEVDVYKGLLSGIVLAEVEVQSIDTPVPLPDWVGEEVTGRPEYRKINMLMERLQQQAALI